MITPVDRTPFSLDNITSNYEVNQYNFYKCTIANYKSVSPDSIEFIPDETTKSGSQYMYTEEGVYRKSDHWNRKIALCSWTLDGFRYDSEAIGFCAWSDFIAFDASDSHIKEVLDTKKVNKRKRDRFSKQIRGVIWDSVNKGFITLEKLNYTNLNFISNDDSISMCD